MLTNSPIDLMIAQPSGWLHASLPKIEATNRFILEETQKNGGNFFTKARDALEKRWKSLTHTDPNATRFSIIIPVRNERYSLPSFLGALLTSEIPNSADVQFLFIVNNSSDESMDMIKHRLSWINQPSEVSLPPSEFDAKRPNTAFQVSCCNIRFIVIETATAGKANALNIGNELAIQSGHRVAINIDANNWVEPDSIAMMYGAAKRSIIDIPETNTVLINASEFCPTKITKTKVPVKKKTQIAEVSGCMFAWSTTWIKENQGFPPQAIEDYCVGLMALSQNKKIVESNANIWVYSPSNPSDENKEMVRFMYGALQLARRFENNPAAMKVLYIDFPHLRPLKDRFHSHVISRIQKKMNPMLVLRGTARWVINEYLLLKARQKLRLAPHGQTWEPIQSTKGIESLFLIYIYLSCEFEILFSYSYI